MAQVNAGRLRFVAKGEYNNATQYYSFDLVNYNGNSYYAKENTIGNLPTDTTKWQLIAEKGNVGPMGPAGATGNGISSVRKTSTSGLVDTYTITYTNGTTTTFDITNGEDGEVTQEQLDKVQAELDYYKMLENALPKVEGEGESITLDNTAKCPMKLGFKGQIQQDGEPTPTNPIDIHIVSGDNEIKVEGKNLLPSFGSKSNYSVDINSNNYEITINGTPSSSGQIISSNDFVLEAGTYKMYSKYVSGTITGAVQFILLKTNAFKQLTYLANNYTTDKEIEFTLDEKTTLRQCVYIGGTDRAYSNFKIKVQIVKGTTISDFVEHKEYTKEINLGDIEVGGIGEYEDEFFKNTTDSEYYDSTLLQDKWYLKKRIGKKVLDGSENENWVIDSTGTENYSYRTTITGLPIENIGYSNYFKRVNIANNNTNQGFDVRKSGTTNTQFRFRYGTEDTLTNWKTWLSTHNTIVYYALATPTNILLNDTLQETLDSFYSWQEQTNIMQENNDLPFVIRASAIRDMTKIYDI